MADIVMPRLSDTMEEGTILRWLKSDGELVARGQELVEIETDKATMTYESDQDGVLQTIAQEGATLAVGEVIARVGASANGGARGAAAAAPATVAAAAAAEASSTAAGEASLAPADEASVLGGPAGAPGALAGDGHTRGAGTPGARVKASPLARRIARERGIALHGVAGSGPGGRIVKADVEAAAAAARVTAAESGAYAAAHSPAAPGVTATGAPAAAPAGALGDVMTAKGQSHTVELTRTQQTIARRMAESRATIPDFTLQLDVDMDACVGLREQLARVAAQAPAGAGGPTPTPTYNDMVVKASALALREHPRANASYRDGRLQLHSRINIGVAVAAQDALIVPTVFDADTKALGEVARETRALVERVRAGTITPPELGGGTFTVSNLGMYGVRSFTAIINPPQVAIMSVGSLEPRAVVFDGGISIRRAMTLTLVCDHRVLYGADAAQFLARVRELLQTPAALTL
jgi:pyruvate dehydrogenase E2 component (dihydrolipoyllysine-residue acetyltransferase)